MKTRGSRFLAGLLLMGFSAFDFLVISAPYPVSGLRFSNYLTDMVEEMPVWFLFGVVLFLAGCGLMIVGVVSRDPPQFRPSPVQMDLTRANLEPWKPPTETKPPAEIDKNAITGPGSSDIQ